MQRIILYNNVHDFDCQSVGRVISVGHIEYYSYSFCALDALIASGSSPGHELGMLSIAPNIGYSAIYIIQLKLVMYVA